MGIALRSVDQSSFPDNLILAADDSSRIWSRQRAIFLIRFGFTRGRPGWPRAAAHAGTFERRGCRGVNKTLLHELSTHCSLEIEYSRYGSSGFFLPQKTIWQGEARSCPQSLFIVYFRL